MEGRDRQHQVKNKIPQKMGMRGRGQEDKTILNIATSSQHLLNHSSILLPELVQNAFFLPDITYPLRDFSGTHTYTLT